MKRIITAFAAVTATFALAATCAASSTAATRSSTRYPPQRAPTATLTRASTCQTIRHVANGTLSMAAWDHRHGQLMDETLYFSFFCGNSGTLERPGGFTWPMVRYLDCRNSVMAKMPNGLVFWSALAGD